MLSHRFLEMLLFEGPVLRTYQNYSFLGVMFLASVRFKSKTAGGWELQTIPVGLIRVSWLPLFSSGLGTLGQK